MPGHHRFHHEHLASLAKTFLLGDIAALVGNPGGETPPLDGEATCSLTEEAAAPGPSAGQAIAQSGDGTRTTDAPVPRWLAITHADTPAPPRRHQ